jgi:glucose-6-phosphate isomerase
MDPLDEEVISIRDRFLEFGDQIFQQKILGFSGKTIDTVVNIGIGGSDLGPKFLYDALRDFRGHSKVHFVSNVDGLAIHDVLSEANPETTLFIVCSKTFTTQETLQNAQTAKNWLVNSLSKDAVSSHFVAVSTQVDLAKEFGINESRIFGFWDWVGGRYSLWSAVGLSLVCAIGATQFRELLEGAECADHAFKNDPIHQNLPVILAAVDHFYFQKNGFNSKVVAAYSHRLSMLVPFLQQLVMESNGKGIDVSGNSVNRSGVVWWGAPGTDAQHSFFQLLHQGTEKLHVEFIGVTLQPKSDNDHQIKLLSNLFAQSRALMIGEKSSFPEKEFSGNRPSTTLLLKNITPKSMGFLVATYEHRVLCEAALLNINPFDQFGVELGKKLCNELLPVIKKESNSMELDSSTEGLIQYVHRHG